MSFTDEDGKILIKLARDSISAHIEGNYPKIDDSVKERFEGHRGAFVTLTIDGELRGCIGFTEALFPLWEAVSKAARAAALEDPRFPPLEKSELKTVKIEVSVLSKPKPAGKNPEKYESLIEIGKHGLIVEKGFSKGLLLPQVFTEYKSDSKRALEMTCQKAGLPPDAWKDKEARVYLFSAQIFTEG